MSNCVSLTWDRAHDSGLTAPWFTDSDSSSFGDWLTAVACDVSHRRALGALAAPLLTLQADWMDGSEAWTTPLELERAATQLSARLMRREAKLAAVLALYDDDAGALVAELRDVARMARWARDRRIRRVALRVEYPMRIASGMRRAVVYASVRRGLEQHLQQRGFRRVRDVPLIYRAPAAQGRTELQFEADGYASSLLLTIDGELPCYSAELVHCWASKAGDAPYGPFGGTKATHREAGLSSGGKFVFEDAGGLRDCVACLRSALDELILKARIVAGATRPLDAIVATFERDPAFAVAAAGRADVHPELLLILSARGESAALEVAANRASRATILRTLATHPSHAVRARVAARRRVGKRTLARLALDRSQAVRLAVAANQATPVEVLRALALGDELPVRTAVLTNLALPAGVAAEANAAHADGSDEARAHTARWAKDPRVLDRLARDESPEVRAALCRNPDLPEGLLRLVVQAGDVGFRRALASGPKTLGAALRMLAHDPDESVRVALAACPHKRTDVYETLAGDASASVRGAVAKRVALGAAALGKDGRGILGSLRADADPAVRAQAEQGLRALR